LLPALLLAVAALRGMGLAPPAPVAPAMLARYEVRLPYYIRQLLAIRRLAGHFVRGRGTIAYVGRNPEGIVSCSCGRATPVDARPLAGHERSRRAFFSAGRQVDRYFVNGRLFKVPWPRVADDAQRLHQREPPVGVWDHDGTIRFVGPH
jgi:hypothetical protein